MDARLAVLQGIRSISQLYDSLRREVCRKHGLTAAEADILSFLSHNPQFNTAGDICRLRRMQKGNVSRAVDDLCRRGLLCSRPDPVDGRRSYLYMTEQADPVLPDIWGLNERFFRALTDGFTREELELYHDMSRRLSENAARALERK